LRDDPETKSARKEARGVRGLRGSEERDWVRVEKREAAGAVGFGEGGDREWLVCKVHGGEIDIAAGEGV
jgi:hypothetical protein